MDTDTEESHFYGTEEEKQLLQARVDRFDVSAWAKQHKTWGFGSPRRHPSLCAESTKLHNPYAGVGYAWQLTETLDQFFTRLPPATTDQSDETPWIFVCNPYVSREGKHGESGDFIKGNEDEAPAEKDSQLQFVVQGAIERLDLLADLKRKVESSGKSTAFVNRELLQEKKQAVSDILALAHAGKVRSGKWMLFCPPSEVNEVWRLVAKATAQNELGIAAKVAPRPQFDDNRKDRLICVYTTDFQDKSDVGRVLQQLKTLKLAENSQRSIYYKPDIFTYIGLAHGNPWGLAASIYNSQAFTRQNSNGN